MLRIFRPQPVCLNPCSNGICSKSRSTPYKGWMLYQVLILVLMEYALRDFQEQDSFYCLVLVLILVLMEYALRAQQFLRIEINSISLNPCSNGICSKRPISFKNWSEKGLNPCSNGICSKSRPCVWQSCLSHQWS